MPEEFSRDLRRSAPTGVKRTWHECGGPGVLLGAWAGRAPRPLLLEHKDQEDRTEVLASSSDEAADEGTGSVVMLTHTSTRTTGPTGSG
jgi:hypothetical protein